MADPHIRPLASREECEACVRLQHEIWGPGFSQVAPVSILQIALRLGGVASGAFDETGTLLGFVFGLTGLEDGRLVHWSDMLAVQPAARHGGLGLRLKLHQRESLLARGVERVYWTFDPLEAGNAHLNLARLGALGTEYVEDMYGPSDSPLHRGLGTDRLVVCWDLDSDRVATRLGAGAPAPVTDDLRGLPVAFDVQEDEHGPRPDHIPHGPPGAERFRVPIPRDIQRLRDQDEGLAALWRRATRAVLGPALHAGGVVRDVVGAEYVSHYIVEMGS